MHPTAAAAAAAAANLFRVVHEHARTAEGAFNFTAAHRDNNRVKCSGVEEW